MANNRIDATWIHLLVPGDAGNAVLEVMDARIISLKQEVERLRINEIRHEMAIAELEKRLDADEARNGNS